ncbi:hypothetical protein EXS57_01155 [Candidatus Kaiserbacteria bacterium]|nr:hypothetical protein [Candidatus Kaiserbacteria bacterium]
MNALCHSILIVVMVVFAINARAQNEPRIIKGLEGMSDKQKQELKEGKKRQIPNNGGAITMGCREMVQNLGREEQAFFGFFYDVCLAPSGEKAVYLTGHEYLEGSSPAEKQGLLTGDRIVGVNGCIVDSPMYLKKKMENSTATNLAVITIRRGAEEFSVPLFTERIGQRTPTGIQKRCDDIGLRSAR